MRIAYLDCFSGISGDMFLGALVDAGVPPALFEETVRALGIDARVEFTRVTRAGTAATKADVIIRGEKDVPREVFHDHKHSHDAWDGHVDGSHGHSHTHQHDHVHGRGLKEVCEIISRALISESAKQTAIRTFEVLGVAEARVHNSDLEHIHFHEVGAEDAIVDIVCAAVGAEALGVDEWICSPLNVGGGTVKCAHGVLPVPVPAVLELLKGAPVYSSGIKKELVTPTGAAIVKTLVTRYTEFPRMAPERVAYGAGFRDLEQQPNVLRLTIGTALEEAKLGSDASGVYAREQVAVLEANLDDLNPQVIGYVSDRLLDAGALDVFCTPVQMKKGRPGTLLTVLARPEDCDQLAHIVFSETTTIGLRMNQTERLVLARSFVPVSTEWGTVRIKVANLNGSVSNYAPEYEDCRRVAAEHGIPLKQVMQEAVRVYLLGLDRK